MAAKVPLGPPIRLSAAAPVLAVLTRADVAAAVALWRVSAAGLRGLLNSVAPKETP